MAGGWARSLLGGAIGKEGVEHWWLQRLTALALVPLVLWFVVAVISLVGADREEFIAWVRRPLSAFLLAQLVLATFWHAALGLEIVIEDYVQGEGVRFTALVVMRLLCINLAALGIFAVFKMAFGG